MEKIGLLQTFFDQRAQNEIFIAENGDSEYRHYGRGTIQYDTYFKPLLESIGTNSFHDLLRSRVETYGRKQRVLDLLAPPSSFLEYQYIYDSKHGILEKGTAVTLMDTRRTITLQEASGTIDCVVGDLLKGMTWNRLRTKQDEEYDVILCRPQSPFRDRIDDGLVYYPLLKKAWNLLTEEMGMMFIQVPRMYAKPGMGGNPADTMYRWEQFLNEHDMPCTLVKTSVRPEFLDSDMLLVKTSDSPEKFPRFVDFKGWDGAGERT